MGETSIVNDASGNVTPHTPAAAPSTPPSRHFQETKEVLFEKWVYGGDALARLGGRVILAPFVLPDETARVAVGKDVHARLLEVTVPSPERVAAPCPLFARCGGCHYQHAPYGFQVARKAEILREQLRRVGKIDYAGDIETISGPPLGYRNRVQLHIADGKMGYLAAGSHDLVPVEDGCPIASPKINESLQAMRERMRDHRFPHFIQSLEFFTNEVDVQVNIVESTRRVARLFFEWCGSVAAVEYPTSFGTFRVGPRSFFQVNRFLIENLVDAALENAVGGTALDLYAGVGLFALPLTKRFQEVIAVEAGASAVRDLAFNATRAGATLQTEQARVEDFIAGLDRTPDFILADPPRAGLGKTVAGHLERLAPPHVAIVSCDPATLARDLTALPHYKIRRLTVIDLFPQTYHLEAVAQLEHV